MQVGGCLGHLVSSDLASWEVAEPFILPGLQGDPECPDYFEWHGWYYLIFSNGGVARYRMSRSPLGPWTCPRVDTFDGPMASVMKTAAFTGDRRLGVAFLPSLDGDRDDGGFMYAGNAIFREVFQHDDGTLGTRWPEEMIPASGEPMNLPFEAFPGAPSLSEATSHLAAYRGGTLTGVPQDFRLTCHLEPSAGAQCFGFCLRGEGGYDRGYDLRFWPQEGLVEVARPLAWMGESRMRSITGVDGMDRSFDVDVVFRGDILDVCIDQRRTLICRCPEVKGDRLFISSLSADVTLSALTLRPLI